MPQASSTHERAWFSATVRTACVVEQRGTVLFMDSVHIFMAAGWEDARERALELGRSHEADYTNADGASVRWRCAEILTLDILAASTLDGAEVHSRFVDVTPPTAADDFRPEDSKPYQTL